MAISMGMIKVTMTLDEEAVRKLERTAKREGKPKSEIVRQAISDYDPPSNLVTGEERQRMLRVLDEIKASPPTRTQAEIDAESAEIRESRRTGWRDPL